MSDIPPEVIDWCGRFARALGTEPPTPEEIDTLLALAGVAAHASQRQAAPVACWLAARAGVDPARAHDIATSV
ncbi:MAG TPA: DUF6457 domain-containing protein [Acidimicrobiales bacterium]|nr:DUF6457 domain-containing protein [Acidimicrobiales bacterium]